MDRKAPTDHAIQDILAERWSPYAFADRDVDDGDLRSLFEAARWAASSYNEQPWSYVVARRADAEAYACVLSCLVEANQAWAKAAPVLALGVTRTRFTRNDKPNKAAAHDLGLASGNLSAEATARGLVVHQMIGIDPERARSEFSIPDHSDALTALAIGYAGDPQSLDEAMRPRDTSPRSRKTLAEFVYSAAWGEAAPFVD